MGVRIVLRFMVFAFLGVNLWYRFSTIFDYSEFIGGFFVLLAAFSLLVILYPGLLRAFLFFFGASFFLFGFRAYDIQSQVFETVVVFAAITMFVVNLRRNAQSAEGMAQRAWRRGQSAEPGSRLRRGQSAEREAGGTEDRGQRTGTPVKCAPLS